MRKITCSEMGGGDDCQEVFEAATLDEAIEMADAHAKGDPDHADIVKEMESWTDEQFKSWKADMQKIWDSKPEE